MTRSNKFSALFFLEEREERIELNSKQKQGDGKGERHVTTTEG